MSKSIILFVLAGLAEIGGAYLIWLWIKNGLPVWYGVLGGLVLIVYGILPALQDFPNFGRVYAAYGGLFIVLALLWGWGIDGKAPDFYDALGAALCLIGAGVILWAPR